MLKSTVMNKIFMGCSLLLPTAVSTVLVASTNVVEINGSPPAQQSPVADGNLVASANASKAWLGIVDSGQYDQSWNDAATLMKITVSRDEWKKIMNKTRQPLGSVKTREVVDQRTSFNPRGMPAGNYMVMVYKTSFANKSSAYELVTLAQENGQWHVLTYQID